MERLIKSEDIPDSLWQSKGECLQLAPELLNAWKHLLHQAGMFEKAQQPAPHDIDKIGGLTREGVDDHLAWRFTGSSARVQLCFLDPRNELGSVTDVFAKIFSGGDVLIADLPSGSGAAVLSILCTISELRRQGRVPREPLCVKLVGGELSYFAREYAQKAWVHIKESLSEQAIWIDEEFVHWDATDRLSTATLTNLLTVRGHYCPVRLMVLANFSGFLQGKGKWKEAESQFESLFIHGRKNDSYVVWIEPQTNKVIAAGGFFSRVLETIKGLFPLGGAPMQEQRTVKVDGLGKSTSKVQHPLREHHFDVNLVVHQFSLPTGEVTQ
jgi:hypothetical protein